MNYITAVKHAENFLTLLEPVCTRIEVVGSVKRGDEKSRAEGVHDLEFLLILKPGFPIPEFGRPKEIYKTHLDKLLAELERNNILIPARVKADGQRYKKREIVGADINGFNLELWIVTLATWGLLNMIRTGNSWFSHRAVTNQSANAVERETGRRMPGFLPNDLRYIKGKDIESGESCIKRGDEVLSLPEERDVIELIFGKWIPPEQRRRYALEAKL